MMKFMKEKIDIIIFLLIFFFIILMCVLNPGRELKEEIPVSEDVSEKCCQYNFIDPIVVVSNYDPTKEWYEYNPKTHIKAYNSASLDENGIALANGKYNPVTISQYGLKAFGRYITENDDSYLKVAVKQGEFLLKMQDKKTGAFYYDYDWAVYGSDETLKAPWTSAMAAGNALSLFSRLYSTTKDKKFLNAGVNAMKILTKSVKDGGVVSYFNGHVFYEEYPTTKGNFALNGFMFTLIGLYDFYKVTNNNQAYKLYSNGIKTLHYILPYYDSAGISLYHLSHMFYEKQPIHYSSKYHMVHIGQLELFYRIEKDEVFKYYIDRWKSYVC